MKNIKFAISDAETKSASLARTIEDNRELHKNLMRPVNNTIESANENLQKL
jgi:F0F1-type ATP synthase membrane subunit b/b'